MGFLDNLESSLNSLERQDEREGPASQRRQEERARTVAVGPVVERLKSSDWTRQLYEKTALAGHRIRAKIYVAWIGDTLRLEFRGEHLDVIPEADGVVARYRTRDGRETSEAIDFSGDPDELLKHWLG